MRVLLLLTATPALAQTDFRLGYVVHLTGDTLRGEADYRGALLSSRRCRFRTTPSAAATDFRPAELRAYGFGGSRQYRAALVTMPDSDAVARPPQRFFLELLADGPAATLLSRRDREDETRYYLQTKAAGNEPVPELIHGSETVVQNGERFVRENNAFRRTLERAFADCPALANEARGARFKPSVLMDLVNRYNQCRQMSTAAVPLARKAQVQLGVVAGMAGGRLTFEDDAVLHLGNGRFVAAPALLLGLAMTASSPNLNEKLTFRLEVQYVRQRYDDTYSIPSFTQQASRQLEVRQDYLRVPLLVRFVPVRRSVVRPLLEAGLVVSTALSNQIATRYRYVTTAPYSAWEPATADNNYRSVEVGAVLGGGAQFAFPTTRPLALLARLERCNGFASAAGFNNTVWRYQLLLSMNLTK